MRRLIALLSISLVVVALVAGFGLARPFDDYDPIAEARAERIRVEAQIYEARETALQPAKIALYALFGGVCVLATGLGSWAGFLYLRRKALTIYPDSNGVMPAVLLRRGDLLVDLGTLAGPLVAGENTLAYQLPPGAIPKLQAGANQGAAATRTMRAWATRQVAPKKEAPPWPASEAPREFPSVEVLTGDESHIMRLLQEEER